MQPYQEEYIANLKDIAVLTARKNPEGLSFEEYSAQLFRNKQKAEHKMRRNMELLRDDLFPVLDHIFDASEEELRELHEFTDKLKSGNEELDLGLFCQLHKAFLSMERQKKNRNGIIKELYWLGMGYFGLCQKLVGMENEDSEKYTMQMRLCFTEAAAYLKYYDEIEDTDTRGYILRSRANMAMGRYKSASEKVHMVRQTLQIMNDKDYQEKEPKLPWDRFIYVAHQQMAASISYNKDNDMSSQDIEDIMESVYIVYQRWLQEAAERNEQPPIRPQYSYNVIEYYCGLVSFDEMLTKLEGLMDSADTSEFSERSMYGIISLPAFYCQFLKNYPEKIPKRKEYIEELYKRILDYVDVFPDADKSELLFLYLRQLSSTYLETEGSIPYKEFLKKLLLRFAPDIYVHARVVGEAAAAFCKIIIEEEPTFFDDMDFFREITDLDRKKQEVLDYAMECGLLYDIGKINFMSLYTQTMRQWFEEEYEMSQLHTLVGESWLAARPSTQRYAAIALGHHSWYDGSRGYPSSYKRLECPYRQMVDIIGLIDWLDNVTDTDRLYTGVEKTFDEAVQEAIALEGRRFSPLLTARLHDARVVEQIRRAFVDGHFEAQRQIYKESGGARVQ